MPDNQRGMHRENQYGTFKQREADYGLKYDYIIVLEQIRYRCKFLLGRYYGINIEEVPAMAGRVLLKKGFVVRAKSPGHAHRDRLVITDAGKQILKDTL